MASRYRVQYKIIPAGVGPDDYEPADLEGGEAVVELPAPEPAAFIGNHLHSYGPPTADVKRAITEHLQLPDGAEPIIGAVEQMFEGA